MIFIGDVHGKTGEYCHLLQRYPDKPTLQLGDMGLGFKSVGLPPPGMSLPEGDHKFIRGNHDSPQKCQAHRNYAGEFGYWPESGIFYLGGAWSIDRAFRTEGVSWWPDEELSFEQFDEAIEIYAASKPRIVATHECPERANNILLGDLMGSYFVAKGEYHKTRTAQALQEMFNIWRPDHWVFGHYHVTKDFPILGTQFHCLAELDTLELNDKQSQVVNEE